MKSGVGSTKVATGIFTMIQSGHYRDLGTTTLGYGVVNQTNPYEVGGLDRRTTSFKDTSMNLPTNGWRSHLGKPCSHQTARIV